MKYIVIFSLINLFITTKKLDNPCIIPVINKPNPETIGSTLLGEWNYSYSYKDNTCYYIDNLGDLSKTYTFKETNTEKIKLKYPKLHHFGKDKLLFGMLSNHNNQGYGKTTYPMVNIVNKKTGTLKITHYYKGNGIGKVYTYYITSISNDTLVIRNQKYYTVKGKELKGRVSHVYVKKN